MKKTYTKKQITEAIAYWEGILNERKELDERLFKFLAPAEIKQFANVAKNNVEDAQNTLMMMFTSEGSTNWWAVTKITAQSGLVTMNINGVDENYIASGSKNTCRTVQDLIQACSSAGMKTMHDIDKIQFKSEDQSIKFSFAKDNGLVSFCKKGQKVNSINGLLTAKQDTIIFGFMLDDVSRQKTNADNEFLGK